MTQNAEYVGRYEWTRDGWGNLVPTPNALPTMDGRCWCCGEDCEGRLCDNCLLPSIGRSEP